MSVDEFSEAFSTAFDAAAYDAAAYDCWPVDHACCSEAWEKPEDDGGYTEAVKTRADMLAASTLRMLTGYRVGGCPITVRPCREGCAGTTWATYPAGRSGPTGGSGVYPVYSSGTWLNVACGCGVQGCSCTTVCEVRLSGEVGGVTEVMLGGTVLDPSAYRVDNGNLLTRIDGDCWPLCQDLNQPDDGPDAFAVTYIPGALVDGFGAFAAGRLACEYAKACTTGDCELPPTVTQVVRQGVTYTMSPGVFSNGLTGIREVDAYILRWNPHLLRTPSAVWSPDVHRGRVTGRSG